MGKYYNLGHEYLIITVILVVSILWGTFGDANRLFSFLLMPLNEIQISHDAANVLIAV